MTDTSMAELLQEASNTDQRDPNLWAKCFVEADGDEKKAQALYVKAKMPSPTAPTQTHGWCPNCSNECKLDASACQKCGATFGPGGWLPTANKPTSKPNAEPTETTTTKKGGIWKWILGVPVGGFAILMIIGFFAGNSPEGDERATARNAIKYCWSEQSKKSLTDSTARFVASTCEMMESDYRAKWGRNP